MSKAKRKTTALLDGDVYAYQAAHRGEFVYPFDEDPSLWVRGGDMQVAVPYLVDLIERDREAVNADDVVVALSDPDRSNLFRKQVLPTYKSQRSKTQKPCLIPALVEYLKENYRVFEKPTLEGDDVLGILATHPRIIPGDKVVVTIDKDLRTIPGVHYNPRHEEGLVLVEEAEAEKFFLMQALAGDPTDGYDGCPGVGMTTAAAALELGPHTVQPYEHEFKRGARKGETETRWAPVFDDDVTPWQTIVSYYEKAGLGEEEALRQARCARILRASDYDFKTQKVRLWSPS